jgi:hypothetical protein
MVASPLGEDGQRRFTILESGDTEKTSTLIGKPFISLLLKYAQKVAMFTVWCSIIRLYSVERLLLSPFSWRKNPEEENNGYVVFN